MNKKIFNKKRKINDFKYIYFEFLYKKKYLNNHCFTFLGLCSRTLTLFFDTSLSEITALITF